MSVGTGAENDNFSFSCHCQVRQNKTKPNKTKSQILCLFMVRLGVVREIHEAKAIFNHCRASLTALDLGNSFIRRLENRRFTCIIQGRILGEISNNFYH